MFFELLSTSPLLLIPWILAIMLAIGWHEFAHALAAYLQGDDTASHQGRLTLNPLAHIDPIGFGLMLLTGFGWGKPTPFNPYNLRFKRWGGALVSLAGPLSNLIMMLIGMTFYKILGFPNPLLAQGNLLAAFLLFVVQINVVLCIFNLIPIPPLDGSKVLYSFLGPKHSTTIAWLEKNGVWLLLALVFLGQGVLSWLITGALLGLFQLFNLI